LEVPFERGDIVARLHDEGEVLVESYTERGTEVVARVPRELLAALGPYLRSTVVDDERGEAPH
ncbi:MAG: GTPase HflX, partial [Actinomycetota bacterium]